MSEPQKVTIPRAALAAVRTAALKSFLEQLSEIGVKKGKLEDLCAGFQDGMSGMVQGLVALGFIEIGPEGS